ncbi:MAG TPA: glycosyltransferase family 2 protein [Acidimicrobiales bacterium]|nr:glycosyltransferase family 2 protein [Acidimicrobiales bacterium]
MTAGATRETPRTAGLVEAAAEEFLRTHDDRGGCDIVVVIPAFNEEASVAPVVLAVPGEIGGLRTSALVVDDGSSDATAATAEGAGAMVCRVGENVGQGVALRLGYRLASDLGARYIATADADGQFDPAELPRLMAPLLAGDADFVNGSRRLGVNVQTDRVRRLGVVVFGAVISAVTGVHLTDPSNGLRAWRTEVTDTVVLKQPQYQTSELLIRTIAHGFRVAEVPATMYERSAGMSKKGRNWRYGLRFGRVIATTAWEERAGLVGARKPSRRRAR